MAAYEFFAATTTNLFIQNIKTKAEAYGWTIDFFGLYSGNNRLHLHNADGAHFELWYAATNLINIVGCTGYSSGDIPTAQPGVSATLQMVSHWMHLVIVGPHSIFLKLTNTTSSGYRCLQFGYVNDKVGSWAGGTFISFTMAFPTLTAYSHTLWGAITSTVASPSSNAGVITMFVNGQWSNSGSAYSSNWIAGVIRATTGKDISSKMPFAYSGGIIPVPILLTQVDPVTITLTHPVGYSPDARCFSGGNVYTQLEEITINGEKWIGVNQEEPYGTFANSPNLLLRLAV